MANRYPSPEELLQFMRNNGMPIPGPAEQPILKCSVCNQSRQARKIRHEGVKFIELPGAPHGEHDCPGVWGDADPIDQEFSALLVRNEGKTRMEACQDKLADFYTGLTDRGVDGQAATFLTMRFADGQISPQDFEGWI